MQDTQFLSEVREEGGEVSQRIELIVVSLQVPAAWDLQGAGLAVVAGRDASPLQQHGVCVAREAGAVQGVRESAHHHQEDHREYQHERQDNSGLAPGEELFESEYFVFLLSTA